MCFLNFLLITSKGTGTRMLVNRELTSKDTRVLSGATFCFLQDSAKPLLEKWEVVVIVLLKDFV